MKCYQKAFVIGNEFGDEKFRDAYEVTEFECPEQFFKRYNIEIDRSNCTWDDRLNTESKTLLENTFKIAEKNRRCLKCWSREFKSLKGDM